MLIELTSRTLKFYSSALVVAHGGILLLAAHAAGIGVALMFRVIFVLFWVCLLVGTLVAHNVVTNWAVTLAGLYFLARWWGRHGQRIRSAHAAVSPVRPPASNGATVPVADVATSVEHARSRWTVDRIHTTDRRWR